MKRILCPTDFSETADNAIAYAAKLAQVMQADLTLYNVESSLDFTPEEIIAESSGSMEHPSRLEVQSRQVASAFNISCYAEVETSYARLSAAITDKAIGYDLIVMGTNGRDDVYQFFAGSNTYNAILKAKTPILIIPDGVGYSEIRSVVYAYDYFRAGSLPFDGLKPFIEELKCRVKVLQVLETSPSKEIDKEIEELQFIIRTFHRDLSYEFDTVHNDNIAQGIHSYMLRNQADVLALCSVQHGALTKFFHKSTIKTLSSFFNYPIYVFHN